MGLEVALLLLTLNDASRVRMTLSPVETMSECARRAEAVSGILAASGHTIIGMRCGMTDVKLAPFAHGAAVEDERWTYVASLKGEGLADGFAIEPADATECRAPVDEKRFCAVTSQAPAAPSSNGQ